MNLPTENNLTLLKKYYNEAVLIALTTAVVYLFIAYNNLNNYIRDEFIKQTVETSVNLKENTKVLQETQQILLQLKQSK